MAILEWDAIVDANRQGDYETVQAADDALDGGAYMAYVKAATYAGFTVATDNVVIFCEPGTVITSAVILSGAGVCLVLGAGCDVQALITLSGVGNSLICENGVDLDGVLCSGASCYVTGGGWNTLSDGGTSVDGLRATAADCIFEDIATQTTAGGGNSLDGVSIEGARAVVSNVKVVDSDDVGIAVRASDADVLIINCQVLGSDGHGLSILGPRARVVSTRTFEAGDDGIALGATADDSIAVGNIVQDQASQSVDVDTDGENCVVHANRLDGAAADNSGTSVVADNDEAAF